MSWQLVTIVFKSVLVPLKTSGTFYAQVFLSFTPNEVKLTIESIEIFYENINACWRSRAICQNWWVG